jgi:hypothetical protein
MSEARSINGRNKNSYKILVGKPEGMRPFVRLGRRWEVTLN